MSTPNDGGPAFCFSGRVPVLEQTGSSGTKIFRYEQRDFPGMSLRQWFAGQALAGLIARTPYGANRPSAQCFTDQAYEIADAMLTAKARGGAVGSES